MLRTFLLTTSSLIAMAKRRPWEPLLIMAAIVLANAGLVTVLLINEGATQGELLQQQQGLLNNIITSANTSSPITKSQYALLRKSGFTQLVAVTERDIFLACENGEENTRKIKLVGIDTQPFLGNRYAANTANNTTLPSAFFSPNTELNREDNTSRVFRSVGISSFSVNALIHPVTNKTLSCHTNLVERENNTVVSGKSSDTSPPFRHWPATVNTYTSALVAQNTLVISIADFYKGQVRINGTFKTKQSKNQSSTTHFPLTGLVSLTPISQLELAQIENLLGQKVSFLQSNADNDTGSLPDSFRLNLWAMSALMGVVALFIVLNALNLMYRTRLPNIIRLRQLGVPSRTLVSALFAELLLYCFVSIPLGMDIGFKAAALLSPAIAGTFTSLFNAVFINPDVNLLSLFGLALFVTFLSLALFSLVPVTKLSNALTDNSVKKANSLSFIAVFIISLVLLSLLFATELFVISTASALLFVALLLLISCVLVLLWLPILSNQLARLVPRKWPVFHYVIANMYLLSSKTRLAVCAFFIALTANIGMNTMTDSFRNATEQWLTQRLYAPYYLYTDLPLSQFTASSQLSITPLLKAKAKVVGILSTEESAPTKNSATSTVFINSYPTHQRGKTALVLDSILDEDTAFERVWQAFSAGEGVFINQQLAFEYDVSPGDTLDIANISILKAQTKVTSSANSSAHSASSNSNSAIFTTSPTWKVLGIYPDYGNLTGQVLVPLTFFNKRSDAIQNALFSGVMAIYPKSSDTSFITNASTASTLTLAEIEEELSAMASGDASTRFYTRQQLLDISMETFDRTFVLTDGLNITTLLVAGIAFAVSLTVLTIGSSAQLSVLRALGVSQFKVKLVLFMQYMLLFFLAALLAIPFGIYLAFIFINLVNRYAFSWVYPLTVSSHVIFFSVGLSLAVVSVVLLLPLGKLKPKIDLRQEVQL
ncbi:FtsX-like permease family protein [Alteromonas gracilis]|uniref:FtsX-like permease family protein n=1 Tax=Alteromonas gracilis TaxID=1479524 RepID=UPI003735885B